MRIAAVFGCVCLLLGCDQAPDASREWTPADHDQQELAAKQQQGIQQGRAGPAGSAAQAAQLIEIAWMQNCAECHGARGQGDGPKGPMLKAPDLTSAEWQAKVKDEEIEEQILKGKGQMPAFPLPQSTVKGLVARIRALRAPQ